MAGVNFKYHTQGEVFSQLFIYPVRYKDHIDLISPIVGLTTTVSKFILENQHDRRHFHNWRNFHTCWRQTLHGWQSSKYCSSSCIRGDLQMSVLNHNIIEFQMWQGKCGTKWKLITSYIVLQDDVVMVDMVVDKVNLGCQHLAQVKFQLLCHLEL